MKEAERAIHSVGIIVLSNALAVNSEITKVSPGTYASSHFL